NVLELLVQKGVFPYSYIDSFEKLNETTFPPIEAFYNDLKDKALQRKDYERGLKLWETFRCKSLRDYMELYLTCDVLLLADCFEEFRSTSFQNYGLDPSHYVSSPALSWDAMLKYTKEVLELITDPDMALMLMEGI